MIFELLPIGVYIVFNLLPSEARKHVSLVSVNSSIGFEKEIIISLVTSMFVVSFGGYTLRIFGFVKSLLVIRLILEIFCPVERVISTGVSYVSTSFSGLL